MGKPGTWENPGRLHLLKMGDSRFGKGISGVYHMDVGIGPAVSPFLQAYPEIRVMELSYRIGIGASVVVSV
jgi:hypothetical protein